MRGNAVPANYKKRHAVLLVGASRPTTLTLCVRLKATRLWSYGAEFSLGVRCDAEGGQVDQVGHKRYTCRHSCIRQEAPARWPDIAGVSAKIVRGPALPDDLTSTC